MKLYSFRSYTPGEGYAVETRWYSNNDMAWDHAAAIIAKYPATEDVEIFSAASAIDFLPEGVLVNHKIERA